METFERFNSPLADCDMDFIYACEKELISVLKRVMIPYWSEPAEKLSPNTTIGIQIPTKGATAFNGDTKGAAFEKWYEFFLDLLTYPEMQYAYPAIWVNALKDEIRLKEKLPRSFQFPNMIHHLVFQALIKEQNQQIVDNWRLGPIALGLSMPYDWPILIGRLNKFPPEQGFVTLYGEGDVKTFDASQKVYFRKIEAAVRLFYMNLSPEDQQVFEHRMAQEGYRIHLATNGEILFTSSGMSSGSADTSVGNSFVHICMWLVCWLYVGNSPHLFLNFLEHTGLSFFGDDVIFALKCQSHADFLALLPDVWLKLFHKPITIKLDPDITKVSFLGRRSLTREPPGIYYPAVSDVDRGLTSLVHKAPKDLDTMKRFQRMAAFKQLLCWNVESDPEALALFQKIIHATYSEELNKLASISPEYVSLRNCLLSDYRDIAFDFEEEIKLLRGSHVSSSTPGYHKPDGGVKKN